MEAKLLEKTSISLDEIYKNIEDANKRHESIYFASFLNRYASFDSFIKHIHIVLLCLPVVWPNNGLNGITDKTSAAFI